MTDYRPKTTEEDPYASLTHLKVNRAQRRRERISAELARNREGGHRIPTWVMVATCVTILGAFAAMVILV